MIEIELFHWRRVAPYNLDGEGVPLLHGRRASARIWKSTGGLRWYYHVCVVSPPVGPESVTTYRYERQGYTDTWEEAGQACSVALVAILAILPQASETKGLQTQG